MIGKLAVLIPVFNGGDLLGESVRSCAAAGLDPGRYEILVVDNCSSDGAVDRLPEANPDGAPIRVHRNERNLGRIGNWNRALEIAEAAGFRWAAFLFVGDFWLSQPSLRRTLDLLETHQAEFAFAPFDIVDSVNGRHRSGRVTITGSELVVRSRDFLTRLLESGNVPIAPLQANIYSLQFPGTLRFSEVDPVQTDAVATVEFLYRGNGRMVIVSEPFVAWRLHAGRFHSSLDVAQFAAGQLRLLEIATELGAGTVDWNRAKAHALISLLQGAIRHERWMRWPRVLLRCARILESKPGHVSVAAMLGIIFRKLFFHQCPVHLVDRTPSTAGRRRGEVTI